MTSFIDAASHMGRRDIALFLIGKGARTDIFSVAMLGRLEIVQSILTAYPHLLQSKRPHGISLLDHAKAGGEEAVAVLKYLETSGYILCYLKTWFFYRRRLTVRMLIYRAEWTILNRRIHND